MTHFETRLSFVLPAFAVLGLLGCWSAASTAQDAQPKRPLAPGILTVIPPDPEENETWHGPLPLVEVPINIADLDYEPNFEQKSATVFEKSKGVTLRRGIWNLEFAFKPMRMIYVDVPQPTGKMQRKLIWYMVYRVKNKGGHFQVTEEKTLVADTIPHTTFKMTPVIELTEGKLGPDGAIVKDDMGNPVLQPVKIRFLPHFVLQSKDDIFRYRSKKTGQDFLLTMYEATLHADAPDLEKLESIFRYRNIKTDKEMLLTVREWLADPDAEELEKGEEVFRCQNSETGKEVLLSAQELAVHPDAAKLKKLDLVLKEKRSKENLDRIIPAAMAPIKAREFPGEKNLTLHDSISISSMDIPLSDERIDRSVWGVVTWEDIDPSIDYFTVYIQGLTNAFKFEDPAGAFKKGSPPGTGRKFTVKTLQLNFWRPGDTVEEHEEEIHYGVRLDADSNLKEGIYSELQKQIFTEHGIDKPLDSLWIYR